MRLLVPQKLDTGVSACNKTWPVNVFRPGHFWTVVRPGGGLLENEKGLMLQQRQREAKARASDAESLILSLSEFVSHDTTELVHECS